MVHFLEKLHAVKIKRAISVLGFKGFVVIRSRLLRIAPEKSCLQQAEKMRLNSANKSLKLQGFQGVLGNLQFHITKFHPRTIKG